MRRITTAEAFLAESLKDTSFVVPWFGHLICTLNSENQGLASVPSAMREPPNSNERMAHSLDSVPGLRNQGARRAMPPGPPKILHKKKREQKQKYAIY